MQAYSASTADVDGLESTLKSTASESTDDSERAPQSTPGPAQIAECLTRIGKDLPAARVIATKARETARRAMAAMIANGDDRKYRLNQTRTRTI